MRPGRPAAFAAVGFGSFTQVSALTAAAGWTAGQPGPVAHRRLKPAGHPARDVR
ncbi:hypothetical protein L083_2005 [Actinoplanes sp. N902-109]|nr:hypothetical protein L083_2005 [Actinoplanes sp. N902-109]